MVDRALLFLGEDPGGATCKKISVDGDRYVSPLGYGQMNTKSVITDAAKDIRYLLCGPWNPLSLPHQRRSRIAHPQAKGDLNKFDKGSDISKISKHKSTHLIWKISNNDHGSSSHGFCLVVL